MPLLAINDVELYYELGSEGPPLLLTMGATGDAGHFEELAELLALGNAAAVGRDKRAVDEDEVGQVRHGAGGP